MLCATSTLVISSTAISTGLSIFMGVILLLSFLFGLGRGLKKSLLRSTIFIGVSIAVLLFMPKILSASLTNITINGMSIESLIANWVQQGLINIASVDQITTTIKILTGVALAGVGSIVLLVLFILIQIATWILYAILSMFIKKVPGAPKHRFWGGVITLVQGIFVCFIFMIPVAGFSNVAARVVDEFSPVIVEMLPEGLSIDEIKAFSKAYDKSMPGYVYGIGKLDQKTFAYVSRATIDKDSTVSFTAELDKIMDLGHGIIESFDYKLIINSIKAGDKQAIVDYLKKIETGETLTNAERIAQLVSDTMFDSEIVRAFLTDTVNAYAEKLAIDPILTADETFTGIEKIRAVDIDWNKEKATFSTVFASVINNLADVLISGEPIDLKTLPLEKIGEAVDGLKEMQVLKNIFNPAIRVNMEKLGLYDQIKEATSFKEVQGLDLRKIKDYTTISFKNLLGGAEKTLTLIEKMQDTTANIEIGSVGDALELLKELPKELTDQLNDTIKAVVGDVKLNDKLISETIPNWNDLDINIVDNAQAIGGLMDLVTITDNLSNSDASQKLSNETIAAVVEDFKNVSTMTDDFAEVVKTLVNEIPNVTLDSSLNIKEVFKSESVTVEVLLKLSFGDESVVAPTEKEIVAALSTSDIVIQALAGASNATSGVLAGKAKEAELKAALSEAPGLNNSEKDTILRIFGFKA